jgi:two-component system, NtrC family, response regulator PilR
MVPSGMGNILVVDDEQSMREFLTICLRRSGHTVSAAKSPADALSLLAKGASDNIDIVVTDLRMPGDMDGLGLLKEIRQGAVRSTPEVILVTAFASTETAIAAMKHGAYDYLTKPFKVDEINAVISRALEKRALVAENAQLRERVAGRVRLASLLGKSPVMHRIFDLIGRIHSTKTSVLITGESGTGKELVARALHSEGSRAKQPFVAVNCGAIPEELMESELFGHKRGSFTGAVSDKPGLFQEASGGTLFLDEIGELSLGLQVKILRALQERKVKAVGATDELEVDVRVVAATNRELEAEVARGAFRADLYYRLNVIELRLPPLRQRREDIPLLVDHFVKRFSTELDRPNAFLTAPALRHLESYDFPGNVRELENIIERAIALSAGDSIGVDDLPALRVSRSTAPVNNAEIPPEGVDLDRLVSEFERTWVNKALEKSGGVRKHAATLLGISFRSMRYRLAKLGMEKVDEADGEVDDNKNGGSANGDS